MVLPDFSQWINQLLSGDLLGASIGPLLALLGQWFYLIFAMLLAVPLYIKTKSVGPPSILMLLFSGVLLTALPVESHKVVYLLLVMSIAGIIYYLFAPREPS